MQVVIAHMQCTMHSMFLAERILWTIVLHLNVSFGHHSGKNKNCQQLPIEMYCHSTERAEWWLLKLFWSILASLIVLFQETSSEIDLYPLYHNVIVFYLCCLEMQRRDAQCSDLDPKRGVRAGAGGGVQDGDGAGAQVSAPWSPLLSGPLTLLLCQAGRETQVHRGAKRSLCQSASESQKGLFDRADRMLIINNFPPCAEIPAGDQGVVLQPQTLSARK